MTLYNITRRNLVLSAALLAITLVMTAFASGSPASAAERLKYDAAAFAAGQAAGKSILVHVTAPWCPTCKAQKPIVEKLAADPAYKDLTIFEVDFDTGREALLALNARSQSTLIAYKGGKETGRSVGDTNPDSIAALVKSAL
jgi:thiol-disulfide isomerase/thioredoxin